MNFHDRLAATLTDNRRLQDRVPHVRVLESRYGHRPDEASDPGRGLVLAVVMFMLFVSGGILVILWVLFDLSRHLLTLGGIS